MVVSIPPVSGETERFLKLTDQPASLVYQRALGPERDLVSKSRLEKLKLRAAKTTDSFL